MVISLRHRLKSFFLPHNSLPCSGQGSPSDIYSGGDKVPVKARAQCKVIPLPPTQNQAISDERPREMEQARQACYRFRQLLSESDPQKKSQALQEIKHHIERALVLCPGDRQALEVRAGIHLLEGNYEAAKNDATSVLAEWVNSVTALNVMAEASLLQGDPRSAIAFTAPAIALGGRNWFETRIIRAEAFNGPKKCESSSPRSKRCIRYLPRVKDCSCAEDAYWQNALAQGDNGVKHRHAEVLRMSIDR